MKNYEKNCASDGCKPPGKGFRVQVLDPGIMIYTQPSLTAPISGTIGKSGVCTIVSTAHRENILWGKLQSGAGWISLGGNGIKNCRRNFCEK